MTAALDAMAPPVELRARFDAYFAFAADSNRRAHHLFDDHEPPPAMDLRAIQQAQRDGAVVIDGRSPEVFASGHLRGAVNVSLDGRFAEYAGDVARPGVVELPAGSRVIDAVEAVGGAPPDADLDRLNLAAKLVDGERVFVPKVGQADPGVVPGASGDAGADGSGGSAGAVAPGGKVNLNTATQAELETLPGVGPVTATSILEWRSEHGAFSSVDELLEVSGIGDATLAEIAPHVTL